MLKTNIYYLARMLKLTYQDVFLEAGCDEAGRGCLAGPVFAAAVILPSDFEHPKLNDSKQVDEGTRVMLASYIEEHAIAFAVAACSAAEVDEYNILNASFMAMHRAILQLKPAPELLLIDGNRFNPLIGYKHLCMIKGDAKFMHIAAASILAKTYRDRHMESLDDLYPQYKWYKNKGYPTKSHRDAIEKYGPCVEHRKTFQLLPNQLTLDL